MAKSKTPPPETVSSVNVAKYMGKFYEIASIPAWFQRDCAGGTTAEYAALPNGDVSVTNSCVTAARKTKVAKGKAWVVDKKSNSKLKVSFLPGGLKLFGGDYWIIDLGPNYEYAVIGHPSRKYGWILSRTPELPQATIDAIAERLKQQGYDFSKFKFTNQKDYLKK